MVRRDGLDSRALRILKLGFVGLAAAVFSCGCGVAQFPMVYGTVVVVVLVAATILGWRGSPYAAPMLLCFSSMLFAALFAELGLRLFWLDQQYYRSHDRFMERSTDLRGRYRYTPLVDSERTIYGDLAAIGELPSERVYRRERFVTDARGFRNERESAAQKVDILILGDSFAVGADTTQEETWPPILRDEGQWGVYNLGLHGSPASELYVFVTELPNLSVSKNPTLIWMLFSGNDFTESYDSLNLLGDPATQRLSVWESLVVRFEDFQHRSALSRLLVGIRKVKDQSSVERRTVPGHGPMLFFKPYIEMAARTREQIERLPGYSSLRRVMQKMKEVSSTTGFSVLVVAAPSKEDVYLRAKDDGDRTTAAEVLEALSREFSFGFFDLGPVFIEASRKKALWWSDDTHWNPEGNRLAARAIGEQLRHGR